MFTRWCGSNWAVTRRGPGSRREVHEAGKWGLRKHPGRDDAADHAMAREEGGAASVGGGDGEGAGICKSYLGSELDVRRCGVGEGIAQALRPPGCASLNGNRQAEAHAPALHLS